MIEPDNKTELLNNQFDIAFITDDENNPTPTFSQTSLKWKKLT